MKAQIPNILVVDDVVANLVILGDIIRNAGYIPRPVTSVMQAEKAISSNLPQLILLDISMPGVDGFEFCKKLKEAESTKEIPIIFISARNATQDKIKAFELGGVDYISKPFETIEVTHRITTHLKLYSMQKQLEAYNKKLNKIINQQVRIISDSQEKVVYTLVKLFSVTQLILPDHIRRVSKLSRLIAISLECLEYSKAFNTKSYAHIIEVASNLHDIEDLKRLPIVRNQGDAVDDAGESSNNKDLGKTLLQEIYAVNEDNVYIQMAMEIVEFFNERWDGSGYPKGLSGDKIPLSARIVSVVDTYDVLRYEGTYEQLRTHEESMLIINRESGRSFDPFIVQLMNQLESQFMKYYE